MNTDRSIIEVPLTGDDKDFLLTIHYTRRRFFLKVYFILFIAPFWFARYGIDSRNREGKVVTRWEQKEDAKFLSRTGMYWVGWSFLECIVIGSGVFIYMKRIRPYKKDADYGIKQKVSYTIVCKEYFEYINEYYFAFDDPGHLHHQVDAATYSYCKEGDLMYVYKAPRSGYFFEKSGRFSII